MGWDVMILNTYDTLPIAQVDSSALPSFGQRQAFINRLNEFFPQLEWDEDFAYGHLDTEEYLGNIGIGENEIMGGLIWLGIYGGVNPLKIITTLCIQFNCSAYDTLTSEYITIDKPSDKGWKQVQDFRNYVAKRVDKDRSEDK